MQQESDAWMTKRFDMLDEKLDKLDKKLEDYSVKTIEHSKDVQWIKGYIKSGTAALLAVFGAILTQLFPFKG